MFYFVSIILLLRRKYFYDHQRKQLNVNGKNNVASFVIDRNDATLSIKVQIHWCKITTNAITKPATFESQEHFPPGSPEC